MNRADSRAAAIARAHAYFDAGGFVADLRRCVAIPSTSQEPARAEALRPYPNDEIAPTLAPLGFTSRMLDNALGPPVLVAERIEDPTDLTVLIYGHGDTVRGFDDRWRQGLSPWSIVIEGDRIYGRGTADNKGQHSVNIAALAAVLRERGRLGFNVKLLIEMGEEVGSVGLRELCEAHKDGFLKADLLIASDGPRIVLAHALASITDARGTIQVPEWRPPQPQSVRRVLQGVEVDGGEDGPRIDR